MPDLDDEIIVIDRDDLFKGDDFQGFRNLNEINYESRILNNKKVMKRQDAENDEKFKQPIGYTVLYNPKNKSIFAYNRAKDPGNYRERRLGGKWSIGVGGHIIPKDTEFSNFIKESVYRKVLDDEVESIEDQKSTGKIKEINLLGYINDDSDNVGKFHFGILCLVYINGHPVAKSKAIPYGDLYGLDKIERICSTNNVDSWSKIALAHLKEQKLL